ncbi:MAG: hypothetical protein CXR30_00915 [Geobacter sp.]|nr:MAG: hypothetical protein CXR30_00915 [Geobacter sp.]
MKQTWLLLGSMLALLMIGTASWAYDVSGTIYDSSTSHALASGGRAYLMVTDQNGNSTGYGTSLTAADPGYPSYTIKGLPNGTYQLHGFIDTRGNGIPYAGSPIGGLVSGDTFTVTNSDLTGTNVGFIDQTWQAGDPTYPAPSGGVMATPGNSSAIVFWDTPKNLNEIEIADHYNIYWGTNSDVGPGNTVGGGNVTVSSGGDGGHYLISPLANGSYYFGVEAVYNGTTSVITRTGDATVVGGATTGNTVSGTIYITDSSGNPVSTDKPVFVALSQGDWPLYMTYLPAQATASFRNFSIPGVAAGQYELFAFVDQNSDNQKDAGDWVSPELDNLRQWINVQADLTNQTVAVIKQNAQQFLTTSYGYNGSPSPGYSLEFNFKSAEKRPAKIEINAGTDLSATSMTLNGYGDFSLSTPVPTPTIGDTYTGTITYTDSSTETFSLQVSNVIPVMPVQSFPTQQTGPASTEPTFSWRLTGLPAGGYRYHMSMQDPNTWDSLMNQWLDADTLSTPIDPAIGSLSQNTQYNWQLAIVDPFGNSAVSWYGFTPQASGPTISSVSPLPLACGSTDPITITGTGFSSTTTDNHVFFNNSGEATVNSASPTQLVVQLPTCNSSNISTGPVIVSVNGVSASSGDNFIPTLSYNYNVYNSTGSPVTDATVQVAEQPTITTNTNGSGNFTLSNIPTGIPFSLKITSPSFAPPIYSADMVQFANFAKTGGFYMYSQSDVDTWNGGATGKGLIRSKITDNTGANLSGATVVAISVLHKSATYYTVVYDDNSGNFCQSCTTTGTNGRYYVLNVDEGDTVAVSAYKSNYNFQVRTLRTHAGAVSEASLTGTPVLSITSLSSTSAAVGSTISIYGNNFSSTPDNNIVTFSNNQTATVTYADTTRLDVTVPQWTQPGPITVNANGQTATSASSFSVPAPTITSFTPTQAPVGTQVTITGTNFSLNTYLSDNQVSFNGAYTNIISSDGTHLVVNVPYGASTGKIQVQTTGGSVQSTNDFTLLPDPAITSASPLSGPIGTQVTLSGTFYDFTTTNYQVLVQGIPATINSVNSTSLVFTIPNGISIASTSFYLEYNGQTRYSGTFTVTTKLTLSLTGLGTVNDLYGSGFTCSSGSCTPDFNLGTSLNLSATPTAGYLFQGWSGACTGTGYCQLTMDSDKSVTATFTLVPYIKISISGIDTYYPQLQDAFDASVNNDVIKAQAQVFTDLDLVFNKSATIVKFDGGYSDGTFTTYSGYTTLDGKMSMRGGTLKVSKLKIK